MSKGLGEHSELTSSSIPLEYRAIEALPRRAMRLLLVPAACMLFAWVIGAVTNAINGIVSPTYFNTVIGPWYGDAMSLGDVVMHGLLESTVFGVAFAFVFTLVYGLSTRTRCPMSIVYRALASAGFVVVACWTAGGSLGFTWARADPKGFEALFPLVSPSLPSEGIAGWGFVGGSIWGVYFGSVAGLITGCVTLASLWNRRQQS